LTVEQSVSSAHEQHPDNIPHGQRRTIVIAANTSWNLVNFRGNIIAALIERGFHVVAIAPRDAFSDQLKAMGLEFHALEFRSSAISPPGDALLFMRYLRLLRTIRPVAFLGFTIKPNIYGSLAARMLGIPAINNVSGLGTAFIKQGLITRIATNLYRQAFRRSATVFFQNDEDRAQFVAGRIVDVERTRLLPGSGVDLERFMPAPAVEGPSAGRPFIFILIARLLWDKGAQEYVDAARIVRQRYPAVRFQILGFSDVDNRTALYRRRGLRRPALLSGGLAAVVARSLGNGPANRRHGRARGARCHRRQGHWPVVLCSRRSKPGCGDDCHDRNAKRRSDGIGAGRARQSRTRIRNFACHRSLPGCPRSRFEDCILMLSCPTHPDGD
jgi:glycosyltransferase involved in cell wall biosynthesis